jgi:hypothetical protein
MRNYPVFDAFPNSVGAVILAQKLVFLQVLSARTVILLLYYSLEAYDKAEF